MRRVFCERAPEGHFVLGTAARPRCVLALPVGDLVVVSVREKGKWVKRWSYSLSQFFDSVLRELATSPEYGEAAAKVGGSSDER